MKKIKYLMFFVLSFILNISFVHAVVVTYPRTETDLGVNKRWEITDSNKSNVLRTPRVDVSEKIYDFANVMSEEEEQELLKEINSYVSKTNMDMVILTIDVQYSDSQIEDYAADFYDYNDFGIDFDLYSGILFVRNVNQYNRFFNIYTFGDAQRYYPYERCESILDDVYNDIASDNYLSGFKTFIHDADKYYDRGIPYEYRNYYVDSMGYLQKTYAIPYRGALIFSIIVTFIVIFIMIKKNKMVKKATAATTYLDKESLNYTNMDDVFLHSHTTSYRTSSSSGGSSGGGSRGGSSGGGHGGGGGRHG